MAGTPGKIIGVQVNGAFISCEVSCEINFDTDMIPASAVDSGGWKEYIAGMRGWSMGVDANLLLNNVASDIKTVFTTGFINRLPLFVSFSTYASSTIQLKFSGNALVKDGSISAPRDGLANWHLTFQGTGKLTPTYIDFDLLIDAMPASMDWQIIVNEDVTP
jgi:predicted secreted protein